MCPGLFYTLGGSLFFLVDVDCFIFVTVFLDFLADVFGFRDAPYSRALKTHGAKSFLSARSRGGTTT